MDPKRLHEDRQSLEKTHNGSLFHFFPVTVAENSWKTQMSSNFVFSSCKMVVESRQMAAEILFGPRRSRGLEWFEAAICLLETPIFQHENTKLREFGFFKCFLQRDW